MYNYRKFETTKTSIRRYETTEAETIEEKVSRILNNKEPISDSSPLNYTERKDGVLPQYDIRTDRWDIALDAMEKVNQNALVKRKDRQDKKDAEAQARLKRDADKNGGAESIGGTGQAS